jgi:hypothetical protein
LRHSVQYLVVGTGVHVHAELTESANPSYSLARSLGNEYLEILSCAQSH